MKIYRKLNALFGVLVVSITPALAFQPSIHMDMSNEGLRDISVTVEGSRTIRFTEKALDEIADANKDTDIGPGFFTGANHFTEEGFAGSSGRLLSLKNEIIALITQEVPDGESARRKLGTALHTLQDFYAHSNWVERGNGGINAALGTNVLGDPPIGTAVCPGNREMLPAGGGSILTTAYYSGLLGCGPIPDGKCVHGTPFLCDGIAKDRPGQAFHAAARRLAVEASTAYVQGILGNSGVANNDLAKKCLLGIANGTLGVVIDDTGSMGSEINQVKNQVQQIIDGVRGTDDEPKQYLLVRFGDPDVGPPSTTADADEFLGQVNALSPSGGGDCPELAFSALSQAVGASKPDSNLYFFSDAGPKDRSRSPSVIIAARLKNIRVNFILTGTCSPVDPSYLDTAEQTGGLAFLLSPSELPEAFSLVKPTLEDDFVSILLARDILANDERIYTIPVDSTVRRLILSVAVDQSSLIEIVDPSGTVLDNGTPGVSIEQISSGTFATIEAPAAGAWSLRVQGNGDLSVAANANSEINFLRFDFAELVNPIHQTYAPIAGTPLAGSSPIALAKLLGTFGPLNFVLVNPDGNDLEPLDLSQGDEFAAAEEFSGTITLPSVPFRVAAVGSDSVGNPVRRTFPQLFLASSVGIDIDLANNPTELRAGATTTIEFEVENAGISDRFDFSANDTQGYLINVTPTSAVLGTGETVTVSIGLSVPENTEDGIVDLITLVATSQTDLTITNSAGIELPVVTNQPPVCFGSDESSVVLWPPNHAFHVIDLNAVSGVVDPDGDSVSIVATSITQDERVQGNGSGNTAPDGLGVGSAVPEVRAERAGWGNGRVYAISFVADDGKGGSCEGIQKVHVPKKKGREAQDDGQLFDSTQP